MVKIELIHQLPLICVVHHFTVQQASHVTPLATTEATPVTPPFSPITRPHWPYTVLYCVSCQYSIILQLSSVFFNQYLRRVPTARPLDLNFLIPSIVFMPQLVVKTPVLRYMQYLLRGPPSMFVPRVTPASYGD